MAQLNNSYSNYFISRTGPCPLSHTYSLSPLPLGRVRIYAARCSLIVAPSNRRGDKAGENGTKSETQFRFPQSQTHRERHVRAGPNGVRHNLPQTHMRPICHGHGCLPVTNRLRVFALGVYANKIVQTSQWANGEKSCGVF